MENLDVYAVKIFITTFLSKGGISTGGGCGQRLSLKKG